MHELGRVCREIPMEIERGCVHLLSHLLPQMSDQLPRRTAVEKARPRPIEEETGITETAWEATRRALLSVMDRIRPRLGCPVS